MTDGEEVQGDLGANVDRFLADMTARGFSGAVLVSRGEEILLKKGYGLANRDEGIANTSETLFNVASVAKTFTAAVVLDLEARGKLSVEDRVAHFLGDFPGAKSSATIQHLLTHTAGLAVRGTPLSYENREGFVQSLKEAPIESVPGDKYRYTNAGYSLLAAVVEEVTGLPFEDSLEERLFEPAGMTRTGYLWDNKLKGLPMAVGYRGASLDELEAMPPQEDEWATRGPSGIATTVGDLYRWTRALQSDIILPRDKTERMFTAYIGDEGYGWHVLNTQHGRLVRRGGGAPDFESSLRWYLDEDIVIAFAINNRLRLRVPIAEGIEEIVLGSEAESR